MMFQAVLSNRDHPEYGVATIPFPIPRDQYAHCMELLAALEIGDTVKVDCISSKASSSSSFSSIGVSKLAYEAYFRSEMEQKLRMQSEESLRLYRKRLAQAGSESESLTAFSSAFMRTMSPDGWTMSALP